MYQACFFRCARKPKRSRWYTLADSTIAHLPVTAVSTPAAWTAAPGACSSAWKTGRANISWILIIALPRGTKTSSSTVNGKGIRTCSNSARRRRGWTHWRLRGRRGTTLDRWRCNTAGEGSQCPVQLKPKKKVHHVHVQRTKDQRSQYFVLKSKRFNLLFYSTQFWFQVFFVLSSNERTRWKFRRRST